MNLPPAEYINVSEEGELAFLQECFIRSGLEESHAALISRLLTNSELRGVRSHGINWAPGYCRKLKEGELNPRPEIRMVGETAAAAVFDGDGSLGYWPMTQATEQAIAKAKEVGIGLGMVRHIGHYGAAGHYTRMCLEAGCVGFSVQGFKNDGERSGAGPKPSVAFTGAPPMSFGLPAGEEPAIVLDMVAHALSGYGGEGYEDLPERIPAAFFKSAGLIAVATLLGGGLTGFTLPETEDLLAQWSGASLGGTVVAIDVEALLPRGVFRAEVDRYVGSVRESFAPMPGCEEALLPGAIEEQIATLHREQGIRFGEHEQAAARELSEYLDVPLPWA